jgi:uncharacterized repeat protein (TIGR01451 family)
MKRLFVFIIAASLCGNIFAGAGVADIFPPQAPLGFYGWVVELKYAPDPAQTWVNGAVEVQVPQDFTTPPQTSDQYYDGYVEAFIMRGGTTPEQVPGANVQVSGYSITVTALTMASNDLLKIIYGSNTYGGQGIMIPNIAGKYYFETRVAPGGTAFTPLALHPYLDVNNLKLTKSAIPSFAMAGETVTFAITMTNISAYHQIDLLQVWDTLPNGLTFLSATLPHTQNGNMYIFPAGTLMYGQSQVLTLTAKVNDGAIGLGTSMLNRAAAKGNDMYGNTFNAAAQAELSIFGAQLNSVLTASPASLGLSQVITALLRVDNTGNTKAAEIVPGTMYVSGTGNAMYLSGPNPPVASVLMQGQSAYFTWIYQATASGMVQFSTLVSGKEGLINSTVNGSVVFSNSVMINTPAPTATFTPTKTATPVPTDTYTAIAVTETFTATPTRTVTVIATATPNEPTAVPTDAPTPDAPVYTDKNYIEINKGDRVTINFKAPGDGEASIVVHNISGELIKNVLKEKVTAGYHSAQWDGTNNAGKKVSRGVYFVLVKQGEWKVMKRVVVLK